jgi:WD40 repeat protein
VLRGHRSAVSHVEFSADGRFVLTASDDGTARVWDAANGEQVDAVRAHAGRLNDAAFSPDGMRVVTASFDGTARIHRCDLCGSLAQLLALADRRVTRGLTPAEQVTYLHGS